MGQKRKGQIRETENGETGHAFSKLRNSLTTGLVVLGASGVFGACGGNIASVENPNRTTARSVEARETDSMTALLDVMGYAGQMQIVTERVRVDGQGHLHVMANLVPTQNTEYCWLFYQEIGRNDTEGNPLQLLLNHRYDEGNSQPRYVGRVMRNVTLTDGTRGDFVVRVYGNETRPASAGSEWDAVVQPDGRVSPSDVLYRLDRALLTPVISTMDLDQVCRRTAAPETTVADYGPTTPVLLIRQL